VDIRLVQEQAWANKQAKGFNTSDIALEFGLLTAEISEAFTAWRNRLPDFGEELADVLIYLTGLAQMAGIDLDDEVARKLAKNVCLPSERAGSSEQGRSPRLTRTKARPRQRCSLTAPDDRPGPSYAAG
jgi:NTP pyrophosphatase (non-canonical NTP hydrolase)